MEGFSDLSVGDLRRVTRRYVPVVGVVAAVAVMGLTLPGPKVLGGLRDAVPSFSSAAGANVAATPSNASPEVVAVPTDAPTSVDASTSGSTASFAFSSLSSASASSSGFADSPTAPVRLPFPEDSTPDRSSSPQSQGNSSFEVPTASDSGSATVTASPLRIVASTWATSTAGTPLAAQNVPAKSLPVGKRLGRNDKASYVRLSGTAPMLVLTPHEDAAGQRTPETAVIQACQITDGGWKSGEASSFEAAPKHDETKCVPGVRSADGTWTFDLQSFPLRTDDRGFALVPGPEAPLDFQVAFKAG